MDSTLWWRSTAFRPSARVRCSTNGHALLSADLVNLLSLDGDTGRHSTQQRDNHNDCSMCSSTATDTHIRCGSTRAEGSLCDDGDTRRCQSFYVRNCVRRLDQRRIDTCPQLVCRLRIDLRGHSSHFGTVWHHNRV